MARASVVRGRVVRLGPAFWVGLAMLTGGAGWPLTLVAGEKSTPAADDLVRQSLMAESAGDNDQRTQLLGQALARDAQHAGARWQSGFVRHGSQWLAWDGVPEAERERGLLAEYNVRREAARKSIDGELELARWCGEKQLDQQRRAHLMHVLQLDPDRAAVRALLGFVQVDGVWLSREEIQASQDQARRTVSRLTKWSPRLNRWYTAFTSNNATQRTAARRELATFTDPEAVPALESLAITHPDAARDMVAALAKIKTTQSSLALARLAVFQPWYPAGEAAALALQDRPRDGYVPPLLSALHTPFQARTEMFEAPGGRLIYRQAFYREGIDRKELKVLDAAYSLGDSQVETLNLARSKADVKTTEQAADAAAANRQTKQLTERIAQVLAVATGEKMPADPLSLWKWWNESNELAVDVKPIDPQYQYRWEYVPPTTIDWYYPTPSYFTTSPPPPPPPPGGRHSCLVAGTLIATNTGLVPIETIRIGDLALAQDVATGELAYKPVLLTTARKQIPTVQFALRANSVRASGGHLFWVAGSGWLKARDLTPGQLLHGIGGATRVTEVRELGPQDVFNLVVADFHTYFVGEAKLLSHDNSTRRPADVTLPGLAAR